mmetsp:Transcript_6107/g.7197  ORF Transcript_6107/g.7197 Transcript_6107/m.7197 type:complete len:144 (+) Transcript_6107:227-658(+)
MAIILIKSMSRIDNFRKMLFKDEMKLKNEKLRRAHLTLFATVAIFMTIQCIMEIIEWLSIEKHCEVHYEKLRLRIERTKLALEIIINCLWFFIIGTMITMYKRYFSPLSTNVMSSIRKGFNHLFSKDTNTAEEEEGRQTLLEG